MMRRYNHDYLTKFQKTCPLEIRSMFFFGTLYKSNVDLNKRKQCKMEIWPMLVLIILHIF
jgi:hypothetical protein